MSTLKRFLFFISDLRVAICLLLVIAIASGIGTAIPQGEPIESYITLYESSAWLGIINGEWILKLQLDHVYTSYWFLGLLTWLSAALIVCSWRRQWPALKAGYAWTDYTKPNQLRKLAIAETVTLPSAEKGLEKLSSHLKAKGWSIKKHPGRIAARKGVIGRAGPPIIHIGMILLMFGSAWGAFAGQKIEKFLSPGRSFELLSKNNEKQLTIELSKFEIERDELGRPEQFRSELELIQPDQIHRTSKEISVNHPLRFQGMTIYQADWALAGITLQIGESPNLQLPLRNFPELGDQVWGTVIPTKKDGTEPILLTLSNEKGPVKVFNQGGKLITTIRPGRKSSELEGVSLRIINILPASGLLLKRDPSLPIVYSSFAIILIGGILSLIDSRQLWAIIDTEQSSIHLGGLSNRNLIGLANELPNFVSSTTI